MPPRFYTAAFAVREYLPQQLHRLPDHTGVGKWTEIRHSGAMGFARDHHPGEFFIERDGDIRI
jgi:hypothetical protein